MFSDDALRKEVNDILQPLIRQEITGKMKDYKEQGKSLIVLDIPLLFEMNYESLCDDIIVVAVSVETQIARMEKKEWIYSPRSVRANPITDAFRRKSKESNDCVVK